jgi:hypothetical protein
VADEITVHARAFSALVHDEPLSFEAPRRGEISEEVAGFWWRQIAYAFSLDDPREFPRIGRDAFSAAQIEVLDRFLEAAEELAESEVLNGEYGVIVSFDQTEDLAIEATFPREESVRGLAVLFRQFYSDTEVASFSSARNALGGVAVDLEDSDHQSRLDLIRTWKKAHGRMHGNQLELLVLERLVKEGRVPPSALELHREKPAELISLYNYGALIHFGKERQRLKELVGGGPFEENWTKMEFLISITGFSHFYLGFAELIEVALEDSGA